MRLNFREIFKHLISTFIRLKLEVTECFVTYKCIKTTFIMSTAISFFSSSSPLFHSSNLISFSFPFCFLQSSFPSHTFSFLPTVFLLHFFNFLLFHSPFNFFLIIFVISSFPSYYFTFISSLHERHLTKCEHLYFQFVLLFLPSVPLPSSFFCFYLYFLSLVPSLTPSYFAFLLINLTRRR